MALKESLLKYGGQLETVEGTHVGRLIVSADTQAERSIHRWRLAQRLVTDKGLRSTVSTYMDKNSPNMFRESIKVERAASAYFTWDPAFRNLIIEWGEIVGEEAKLHTYLNEVLDHTERHKKGMTVRSGHIAEVNPGKVVVCMLDSIWSAEPIIRSLNKNGFLVIDGLGNLQAGGDN